MTELAQLQPAALAEALRGLDTLAESTGIPTAEIDMLDALAASMMRERKFDRAEDCLRMACLLSHTTPRLWVRLGDCRRLRKNYAGALFCYDTARDMGVDASAWLCVKRAICHLALGDRQQAFASLAEAEQSADGQEAENSVRQFLEALLASLREGHSAVAEADND